jgi:Ca-activated chloride channel family protein
MTSSRFVPILVAVLIQAVLILGLPRTPQAGETPSGSGALDVVDRDGKVIGRCPLKRTEVSAELSGFVARVAVTQVFENPFGKPVEAIYTFPLSERAAVNAMWIRTGDREIRGEIKRREEARRMYEEARTRGQLTGLLDQERPNIFTQSLANLMPGAKVEIRIEYVEPLRYEDGTFEFVFPTVVGPRFIPGQPRALAGAGWSPDTTRVPDASRITPPVTPEGTRAGHDISIAVDIQAGVPILDVESRLHEVDVERPSKDRAQVRLRQNAEIPNRDFVLRYAVAGDEVRSGYLAHRKAGGDGYVTFVLLPPKRVTPETAAPREMIFVIDRSGSQSGLPLIKAKETMLWILDRMNPNDTFQVVDFSSTANVLFDRPARASLEMKRRARAYINALEADGGTMMAEAVKRVASIPAEEHRLRVVTFMTDGYVGNDFEVLNLVRRLRGSSRWFPFGTGNSVNRFLLDTMARLGGGEVEYVLLNDPGDRVARSFYERIASPVLTDVSLEFRDLDVVEVYPNQVADVWAQRPLIVHARYRKPGTGRVILRGYRQGKPYEQVLDVALPSQEESHAAIASMWARARVDDLMARDLSALQAGNVPDALREEIIKVALEHRIMTQFTSFVAVEDRVVNEGGALRTVAVPVEMPQGVTYEGVFGQAAESAALPMAPRAAMTRSDAKALRERGDRGALATEALDASESRVEAKTTQEKDRAPLSAKARTRLAPKLQALVEGTLPASRSIDVVDGRVEVKVLLRNGSKASLQRLEKAGLRIRVVTDGYVLGSIEVARLATLAELDGIERIVPA